MTTCKLIFDVGAMTEEGLATMLRKHTSQFSVATFQESIQIGNKRISFAVVDIPDSVVAKVSDEPLVKSIDFMAGYGRDYSSERKPDCDNCPPVG